MASGTLTEHLLREKENEGVELKKTLTGIEKKKDEIEAKLMQEMGELRKRKEVEILQLNEELTKMKQVHDDRIRDLETEHKKSLDQLSSSLTKHHSMEGEVKEWEHKYTGLQRDHAAKESSLNDKLSSLANELSKTKDQLALVEQRARELERKLSEKSKAGDDTASLLDAKAKEADQLRVQLAHQNDSLVTLTDRYQELKEEKAKMTGTHVMCVNRLMVDMIGGILKT